MIPANRNSFQSGTPAMPAKKEIPMRRD